MNAFEFWIGYPNPLVPTLYPQPDNWQSLELELSFEDLAPEAVFNSTNLIWKGSNAAIMNSWLLSGLAGPGGPINGVGIFEGIPLQIKVCESQQLVFDGIIDLTDPDTKFSCDIVSVKIRDKKMDMINQLMSSITFCYLESLNPGTPGKITAGCVPGTGGIGPTGDYLPIAYQRNDIPNFQSILTAIMCVWEVYTIAEDVVSAIDQIVALGVDAGIAVPLGDVTAFALDIAEMVLWAAYIAVLVVIIIGLIHAMINCLVSPVLVKFGMNASTLLAGFCELGLLLVRKFFKHSKKSTRMIPSLFKAFQ
jgi:hypothetical protein